MEPRSISSISRRGALLGGLGASATIGAVAQSAPGRGIGETLEAAVKRYEVPGVVAMVATPDAVLYKGTFGKRNVAGALPMLEDAIFALASMTKPVTTVAAMQLIEQKKIGLEDPVQKYVPAVGEAMVLAAIGEGRDELRAPKRPITVRHLLTHTAGYGHPIWSRRLSEHMAKAGQGSAERVLLFDPGEQWMYGASTNFLGRLVETVSANRSTGISRSISSNQLA
jgi:methyl acetate hydrolase